MPKLLKTFVLALALAGMAVPGIHAQTTERVVDIPTRAGVTQRLLVISPASAPKAALVLFAGGHGGLQMAADGAMQWGGGNFLIRSRSAFADQGLLVAVLDAPSDRQSPPYLSDFRQSPEHAQDVRHVIAWLRETAKVPVWLVGTSRGTQSVAYVATELPVGEGPDGIVLTSSILSDTSSRPLPAMPLDKIKVPVLVVHHERDGCKHCAYADIPQLMGGLAHAPRKHLQSFTGGVNQGKPCQAKAYHGFNGIENSVVEHIAGWVLKK